MRFAPFAFENSTGLDSDAQLYLNAVTTAGGTYTSNQSQAVNQLFIDLKSNNLYTKIQALYPFVGGTAASNKFNAKNPVDTDAAYRITFSGGWTYNASGVTANGTNCIGNTHLVSTVDLLDYNKHYAFFNRQTSPNSTGWDGIWDSAGTGGVFGCNLQTGGQLSLGLNFLSGTLGTIPNYNGTFIGSVTGTTNNKFYKDGSTFYTRTPSVSAFNHSLNFYIGSMNVNGTTQYYNNNKYGFYAIGTGISTTEASIYNTIITNYITTSGR